MDQEKVIKRMQIRQQKIKIMEQKMKEMEAQKRKLEERIKATSKNIKNVDNQLETDHSIYLLTCLRAINLDPVKDRAIILGSLGILSDSIQAGTVNSEIDDAIEKYRELVSKKIVNEAAFEDIEVPEDNSDKSEGDAEE